MKKTTSIIFLAVFVVLMGIFAIGDIDWNVSNAIINPHSFWANFMDQFGEMPAFILFLFGIVILFGSRRKDILWRNILGYITSWPFILLFIYMIPNMPVRYMYENHSTGMAEEVPLSASLIAGLFSIGLFFLVIYALRKISYDKFRSMRKTGLLLVLFVILEMVLVNVVKVIWGRPRMRIIESYEQFTKWYEIVGPAADNNFKSFPSGHTANGFVTIAIPLVLSHFKLNRKWVLPVCLTWGSLVALSRVVLGAHFLSDVTVGAYISILIYFTLESIIKPKNK